MRSLALIASALLLVAGCGQRGALYLRDSPPPGVKAHKSESYEPVPYPAEDAERTSEKK